MFYVVNFSHFNVKPIIFFPILARGLVPKIAGKTLNKSTTCWGGGGGGGEGGRGVGIHFSQGLSSTAIYSFLYNYLPWGIKNGEIKSFAIVKFISAWVQVNIILG